MGKYLLNISSEAVDYFEGGEKKGHSCRNV